MSEAKHTPGPLEKMAAIWGPDYPWRSIDTAPHDREIILAVFRSDFVDPIIQNSIWIDGEEKGCYWLDWHGMPGPTHWQELNWPSSVPQPT